MMTDHGKGPSGRSGGSRRRHAARGARWLTAGLAVSGTLGMTSYLEIQQLLNDRAGAVPGAGEVADTTRTVSPSATTPTPTTIVIPPPPPEVRVVVVPRTRRSTPAPVTSPVPVTSHVPVTAHVPVTSPTRVTNRVPARSRTHATTRGTPG